MSSRSFPCALACTGRDPLSRNCLFRLCCGAQDIDVAIDSEFADAPIDFRPKGCVIRHLETGTVITLGANGHSQLQPVTDVRAAQQPETFIVRYQPGQDVMHKSQSNFAELRISPEFPSLPPRSFEDYARSA